MKKIDYYLNRVTMYRLLIYSLSFFLLVAIGLSFFKLFPYKPLDIIMSAGFIMALCFIVNGVFAYAFEAPSNDESVVITALILALIITPQYSSDYVVLAVWASVLAMASKYILAIGKKHIFNPAAIAVVLTAIFLNQSASWWIANLYTAPIIFIGGFLIVRKIKRADLLYAFFGTALLTALIFGIGKGTNPILVLSMTIIYSSLMFFAFTMLTEPMTTPPTRNGRIAYGALAGFLFVPAVHFGSLYFTPELALITANIFSYLISPKHKLILEFKEKVLVANNSYDFIFTPSKKINFKPGQYMECTLKHEDSDSRGVRRFFTVASSPTEDTVHFGIKFYDKPSSFKQTLLSLKSGDTMVAAQLAGDFYMPADKNKKLVFIAGGIGVTPFRSMIKSLLDTGEARDIVFFYANTEEADIAYKDIFDAANSNLGIKTIYSLSKTEAIRADWPGIKGLITKELILAEVPDYKERMFYISGPHAMVAAYSGILQELGVTRDQIKVDYFPGFA
ncbi:MAG: RnfABCDGE type electron transport complex subunit D [Candidatus Falkowbacteria bacterium]